MDVEYSENGLGELKINSSPEYCHYNRLNQNEVNKLIFQ
jgi:hypothetical protein